MPDLRPEPWKGVLWFGFFAAVGFGVAFGIRRQLRVGWTPKHSSPRQQRFVMFGMTALGVVATVLVVGEVIRWAR